MSGAFEIRLDHPVEHGGVTYRTITIRPPTNKDFSAVRRAHASKFDRGMALAGRLTGCPPDLLKIIEAVDVQKIDDFLVRHLR